MFRLLFGGKKETFRPVKNHAPGSKREQYSNFTLKTLGSGDIRTAVKLPSGEDLTEWVAANTVDFYNELSLIWGIVVEIAAEGGAPPVAAREGFPPGFEYRWSGGSNSAAVCSGPQYVGHVMGWIDQEINKPSLFPTDAATPFPKTFLTQVKVIFTRLFRVFAIVYCHHFLQLEELGAVSHLNTSFKHFLFFCWEFDLVSAVEQEALQDIVSEIQTRNECVAVEGRPGMHYRGSVKLNDLDFKS
ncbi:MOB1, Mps One binder kinase activator-like 1B [Ochromonadaceae sp. CCMP2298]|nr:MOB1, Mps One binder kinase activator-like 1B [Ochromonadaceae sp. CCMP2298]|mmetsp:Transcript_30441/g.67323  ORF Transcript_30441/g.67323 Transcript_30441/m.67323 type:complete len:244 (+) Transcript_30441:182-913(+)